jgi:hypothetical protein
MFTKEQKDLLKSVARKASHPEFGKANPQLDDMILKLRKENPHAFLRDVDMQERVFIHEPVSNVQLKGFIKPLLERA